MRLVSQLGHIGHLSRLTFYCGVAANRWEYASIMRVHDLSGHPTVKCRLRNVPIVYANAALVSVGQSVNCWRCTKFDINKSLGNHFNKSLLPNLSYMLFCFKYTIIMWIITKRKRTFCQSFCWFEIHEDIALWLTICGECKAVKVSPRIPKAPLWCMHTGTSWDILGSNILGPLLRTTSH